MKRLLALALPCVALVAAGCNSVPVESIEKSFSIKVSESSGTSERVKIDFLWVIDNSTSMCQEQVALARSFGEFTKKLGEAFEIDARVAVTTADMQCDPANPDITTAQGRFSQGYADKFPPSCYASVQQKCLADVECEAIDGNVGGWDCRAAQSALCTENPNGSLNSSCVRRCKDDAECQTKLNDTAAVCWKPSTNQEDWGCMLPPQVAGCPASGSLPAFLDSETTGLDNFRCLATVGVNQLKCFKYEQGLAAATAALSASGPNPDQAKGFLRDEAYLVILFFSDEDDCSIEAGETINEDDYDTCALLNDTTMGGPLTPVDYFVNRYKSLKSDPSRVIVAAIAGDSTAEPGSAQSEADRTGYDVSKGDPKTCYSRTSICTSDVGTADFGRRYFDVTKGFGANGIFKNICDSAGIGPALDEVAELIIRVVQKVCLPKPVKEGREDTLIVTHSCPQGWCQNGSVTTCIANDQCISSGGQVVGAHKALVEGADTVPDSYQRVPGGEECKIYGEGTEAIIFGTPPEPGEEVTIEYAGDAQLELYQ